MWTTIRRCFLDKDLDNSLDKKVICVQNIEKTHLRKIVTLCTYKAIISGCEALLFSQTYSLKFS